MTKKNWISIGALLALVLVVLVIVVAVVNKKEDIAQPETPTSETPASPPSDGEGNPDAGAIETDIMGRQVTVPQNRGGDVLSTSADDGGTCESITSPVGMKIQRVNSYPVLFSTDAGPTQVVNSTPIGYAEGPRGAVLAGINSYMLMMSGGTPSREMLLNHMTGNEEARQELADVPDGFSTGPSRQQASVAFRVRSCTDKAVVVEYALPQAGDAKTPFSEPKWRIVSMLVVKDSGEWRMSLNENTFQDRGISENREGFVEWDL